MPKSQPRTDKQRLGQEGWDDNKKQKVIKALINLGVKTLDQSEWGTAVQLQEKKKIGL